MKTICDDIMQDQINEEIYEIAVDSLSQEIEI